MDLFVLDYSAGWPRSLAWTRPTIGSAIGTVRYIGTPGRPKNITRTELDYRLVQCKPTALVHEEGVGGWMLGGRDAGRRAAAADLLDWTTNLGQPRDAFPGAYLADDQDTVAGQLPAIDDCLRGYAEVAEPGKAWVYGEYDVIEHCVGVSRTARLGWQTRAWSHGLTSGLACLRQELGYVYPDGVKADRSTVLHDYWGQWPYQEDDVSKQDVIDALHEVLHLPPPDPTATDPVRRMGGLAVPRGQAHNGNLAAMLVGGMQAEVNRDNATAAQLRAIAAATDPALLAAAIVAKLPAAGPDGPDLQGAIEQALRDVLGGLNDPPASV